LPIVEVPTYELTLPSQDLKVKYRPFLVKEEKVLLIAVETGDEKEIINAIVEIVQSCTFDKLNAKELPIFDLEYLFLQIRARSIGEKAKFKILCPDDNKTYVDTEVDLTKVEVQVEDEHTNKVFIDENRKLGLVFKYPTIESAKMGADMENVDTEAMFDILVQNIDHIFEGDKIYPAKDSTNDELKGFLENLSQQNFEKMQKFFNTMPVLKHELKVKNPNTNVESTVTLKGLQDFFGSASPITP